MVRHKVTVSITLLLALWASTPAFAETAYFAAAKPAEYQAGTSDAYTLPLSDPADILQARQLANARGGNLIAVAYVMKGADGINRN